MSFTFPETHQMLWCLVLIIAFTTEVKGVSTGAKLETNGFRIISLGHMIKVY